jgi:probable F420-dependent oxidoreductase
MIAPYRMGPLETGDYAAAFARVVEEAGFESLWAVEHVVMPVEYASVYPYDPSGRSPFDVHTVQPDPLIWLAYVAAATTRIRLGTAVLILPQHNPVILAKTLASLDRISGGRMMLGTGVGWVREEAVAVGSSFHDRGRRASEYIRAMRVLWNQPVASFEGEFVNFSGVVCEPRPMQTGGVPIHVGGHSPAAARRAGRLGDGFYPLGIDPDSLGDLLRVMEDAAREAGRDPRAIEITCSGAPQPDLAGRFRDAGIDRMVVFPPTGDLEKLPSLLETFRRDAIEKLA